MANPFVIYKFYKSNWNSIPFCRIQQIDSIKAIIPQSSKKLYTKGEYKFASLLEFLPGIRSFQKLCQEYKVWDFPGGTVVKNPPAANAGDTGSSPGPGRAHMPWSN